MKATGVVRRIDELGRIVIPKEIRKNMCIKEGENLEIYTIDNDIIALKKYSTLSKFSELSEIIISVLYQILNKEVLLVDTSNIINYRGKRKDIFKCTELSNDLVSILNERRKIINNDKTDLAITDTLINTSYIIEPIIVNGDLIGGLIVLDNKITNDDISLIDYSTRILINYIEQ